MNDQLLAQAATYSNTQQTQETNNYAHNGFGTRDPTNREAGGLRFRSRGHRYRLSVWTT